MDWTFSKVVLALAVVLGGSACNDDPKGDGSCQPDDLDGIVGGSDTFVLTVNDVEFTPSILTTQNESVVYLTFTNEATVPRGFVIDCLPTPNDDNCPQESCFEEDAEIAPIQPGATVEVTFETPYPEGIYRFRASRDEEEPAGQFVIR